MKTRAFRLTTRAVAIGLSLISCSPAFLGDSDRNSSRSVELRSIDRYVHTYDEPGLNARSSRDYANFSREFLRKNMNVNCLAWSPDGRLLVSMDQFDQLYVFDTAQQVLLTHDPRSHHSWRGKDGAAFVLDRQLILAVPDPGRYRPSTSLLLLDPRTLREVDKFPDVAPQRPWGNPGHVAVARQSGRVFGVSPQGHVFVYDPPNWTIAGSYDIPDHPNIHAIAAAADGSFLAVAAYNKIWIVDVAGIGRVHSIDPAWAFVAALSVSPDGRFIAAGEGRELATFDAQTGKLMRRYLLGSGSGLWGIDFSPDGSIIATANGSEKIQLWDTSSTQLRGEISVPRAWWSTVAFSPDGTRLAAGGGNLVEVFAVVH